jgi:hypothetical protein
VAHWTSQQGNFKGLFDTKHIGVVGHLLQQDFFHLAHAHTKLKILTVLSNAVQYNCCERVAARILDISNSNLILIEQNTTHNLVLSILQK